MNQNTPWEDLLVSIKPVYDFEYQNIGRITKDLIFDRDKALCMQLPGNDKHYMSPHLFAWLTQSHQMPIEQLLYGFLPEQKRPSFVNAYADKHGKIFFPLLGFFLSETTCRAKRINPDTELNRNNCFFPTPTVETFELCDKDNTLVRKLLDNGSVRSCENDNYLQSNLSSALTLIKRLCPLLYDFIEDSTHAFTLYRSNNLNSFATLSCHGMSFLNASSSGDVIYFLDDICHQCGHIIFNTVTYEKNKFLNIPHETTLEVISKEPGDTRSIYSAFHGLFTYSCVTSILDAYCNQSNISKNNRQHAMGRIAFYMQKFHYDLITLSSRDIFTQNGNYIYQMIANWFSCLYTRYWTDIEHLSLNNQPYVFNLEIFLENNSAASPVDI